MPRSPKSSSKVAAKQKSGSKTQSGAVKQPSQKSGAKELVIVTGISGSGKASALKAFEDLGYYAVDNLPLELLPDFAELVRGSREMDRAVLVVDVREGQTLDRLPAILLKVKKTLHTSVIFLDASDAVLVRRYSETRRPHPLSRTGRAQFDMVTGSITSERQMLDEVRNLAD